MDEILDNILRATILCVELSGIMAIVIGLAFSTVRFARERRGHGSTDAAYRTYRRGLGRSILVGLEILVAADIIATVAIEPSLRSVAILAGIVAIRTFLSMSLEVEIDGRWPWRKRGHEEAGTS